MKVRLWNYTDVKLIIQAFWVANAEGSQAQA